MAAYRSFIITLSCFSVLFGGLVCMLNWYVDPLQFYHRSTRFLPMATKNQRYQKPGLAKNYDYDTIIIGNSMVENCVPSYVERRLGGKALNLSISGSSIREQSLIANIALRTGKVKRVIWGFDEFALRDDVGIDNDAGLFPWYLYDRNPVNDISYLLNIDTMKNSFEIIRNTKEGKTSRSYDRLNTWDVYTTFELQEINTTPESFQYIDKWKPGWTYNIGPEVIPDLWKTWSRSGKTLTPGEKIIYTDEKNMLLCAREYMGRIIDRHPDVKFEVFFPPFSILHYRRYDEAGAFHHWMNVRSKFARELLEKKTVSLYDYQQVTAVTWNIDNYRDFRHYSRRINDFMIDAIAAKRYVVTEENLDELIAGIRKQVRVVDTDRLFTTRTGRGTFSPRTDKLKPDAFTLPVLSIRSEGDGR